MSDISYQINQENNNTERIDDLLNTNNAWYLNKPQAKRYRKLREGSAFFRFTVWMIAQFIKIKCVRYSEGEHNIPESGAAIVIAPHLGSIDAVLATEFVTRCGRSPRILAKKSLWKIPIVKQAFKSGKLIPVERNTGKSTEALINAKNALEEGDVVFIFPEGTYSKDPDSWPMKCKTGTARLALMSGAPVYPILQDGEQFLMKSQKNRTDLPWFSRYHRKNVFGKNRVLVHLKGYPAIDFSDIWDGTPTSTPSDTLIEAMNVRIEKTLLTIVAQSRGAEAPIKMCDNPSNKHKTNSKNVSNNVSNNV